VNVHVRKIASIERGFRREINLLTVAIRRIEQRSDLALLAFGARFQPDYVERLHRTA
jgi:hypothetical protein